MTTEQSAEIAVANIGLKEESADSIKCEG